MMDSIRAKPRQTVILILNFIAILFLTSPIKSQLFNGCPKACVCDESTLESICKESMGTYGLPHTFNPNTKKIIINNASLTSLSQADLYRNLELLDLAQNRITSIDFNNLVKINDLAYFNASHNVINRIDDSALLNIDFHNTNPKTKLRINLLELDLSYNKLTYINNSIFFRLDKLQRLDLSYNQLSTLDDQSFNGLVKLEFLNLKYNNLKHIPTNALASTIDIHQQSSFLNLFPRKISQLKYLDLSHNDIQSIHAKAFENLDHLKELDLMASNVTFISDLAFKDLDDLIFLNLNQNQLTDIPATSFEPLQSLKYLKLSYNNITSVPQYSFVHLKKLEELQMKNCSFKDLKQASFLGLYNLRKLEITQNPLLTTIEKGTFEYLPNLYYLNLNNNSIVSLPDDNLSNGHLTILDLRGNRLNCGCELKWLTKWLMNFNQTKPSNLDQNYSTNDHQMASKFHGEAVKLPKLDTTFIQECVNLTCSNPVAVAGKMIIELPKNNLECLEPTSKFNLNMGFACLFLMLFLLSTISLINYCRYQRHLFVMLKQSFVHHHHLNTMNQTS